MSSRSVGLLADSPPRVRLVPAAVRSDAADAAFLAGSYGLPPDPWQELVLDGWLGVRTDGKWSSPRAGLAVPRQNGKNAVAEIRELFGMVTLGERILHTAHEVKTARKAFARLLDFFDNERQYPELHKLVREIRRTNGQEAILLTNGGSVEFIARSRGSGRGFSVDVLVMDEAQELSEDAIAALLPTISASPNPQQIVMGTPPGPTAIGEVFTRVRNAGVKGVDARLCWHEWSCEPDADLDDVENWAAANPALDVRLDRETIADERAAMDDETFARERLGVWPVVNTGTVRLPSAAWRDLVDRRSTIVGTPVFAVDLTPDQARASIMAGGLREDGLSHVELLRNGAAGAWVLDLLETVMVKAGVTTVRLHKRSPAASLITDIERRGLRVDAVSDTEFAEMCGGFASLVRERGVRHIDQDALNAAVDGASTRDVGDGGWAWSRRSSHVDISPLVGATLVARAGVEPSGGWLISL